METIEGRTMTYGVTGRVARITLNRPHRGNGITMDMPPELAGFVERANLDPAVHVIVLSGNGSGLSWSSEYDREAGRPLEATRSCDTPP